MSMEVERVVKVVLEVEVAKLKNNDRIADEVIADTFKQEMASALHNETHGQLKIKKVEVESKEELYMKKLDTIQKQAKLNDVFVVNKKGPGGGYHRYVIQEVGHEGEELVRGKVIRFQEGPRTCKDSIHGVLDSDLLEIVRHRLQAFQEGEFATTENSLALAHIEQALMWMNKRVENRIEKGVLGTNEK